MKIYKEKSHADSLDNTHITDKHEYDNTVSETPEIKEFGRGRAYRRHQRRRIILRKKAASLLLYGEDLYKGIDGKYSKGHIGCGCSLCKPTKGYLPSWKQEMQSAKWNQDLTDYYRESR